ncbi:hypothetical protein AAE02nite_05890 [Adhaeribacter aerolatus]|uniref:Uncharacterized protein n=1 Tax=Adhaeribacter aerolatus TaxID=670289 RepID=A0A512AT82_9BACT|nr:hypothetical protein [Adhaeribacter aerolatus]GEO02925.1 hypothetical protein AAE02nite_05890 [Adhaeribacter aerolatus]
MNFDYTGLVVTECGRKLKIDLFDQLAVGVLECDDFLNNPSFIPSTFSVYKTSSGLYLLQTTSFNEENDTLDTTYKIIPESEVSVYLENCCYNI